MNRLEPALGTQALRVRMLIEQVDRKLAVVAPLGIADWSLVDASAVTFLLAICDWEVSYDERTWPWVLGAQNDLLHAMRDAAIVFKDEAGSWKLG